MSNSPKLWPGTRFTLTGHPQKMLNREWQVVQSILSGDLPQPLHTARRVNHAGQSVRGDTGGPDLASTRCIANRRWTGHRAPLSPVRRRGNLLRRTWSGTGEVSLDRYHGMTEESSCWVRVSGAGGAGVRQPGDTCVGQEVIVDFLNGDPDQPIIMGRTYHEAQPFAGEIRRDEDANDDTVEDL